jgi:hypothetical protein
VGSLLVVVIDVCFQHGLEMTFAEDKDPVEALGANGPDEALGIFCDADCPDTMYRSAAK